jgi:alpha-tubulin suppressor-like RCC1 family protein
MVPSPVRGAAWSALVLLLGLACSPAAHADLNESADRPLQQAAITAGGTHTCALSATGEVRCWGGDAAGQLGDGAPAANTAAPSARVALPLPARSIAAGTAHTCAVLLDGSVRCWGSDADGRLGDGAPVRDTVAPAGAVALGQPARAVSAGYSHTCALLADGAVRCWGSDADGQLGDGGGLVSTMAPAAPVALGQPARAIAAGDGFTCALLADRSVRCWGIDGDGELGDGLPKSATRAPAGVVGLGRPASAISAGVGHTCALLDDGSVRCWGWNDNRQLGVDVASAPAPAAPVALPARARSISGGYQHTCAVLADDTARCWGYDGDGQLGNGLPNGDTERPQLVLLGQPARAVTAGEWHSCALTAAGTLRCWSNDNEGQLGDGTPNFTTNVPSDPVGLPPFGAPDSADTALTLTTTAASTTAVGDRFTVTIAQANSGPDRTTATVAALLPAGFALDQATTGSGLYRANTGQWSTATIEPGATATLTLQAHAIAPTSAVMVAETIAASAQDPDSTPADGDPTQDDRGTVVLSAVVPPPAPPTPTPRPTLVSTRLTLGVTARRARRTPLLYDASIRLLSSDAPLAEACRGTVYVRATTTGTRGKTLARTRVTLRLVRGICRAKARLRIPASTRLRRAKKLSIAATFSGQGRIAPSAAKRTIKLKRPIRFAAR